MAEQITIYRCKECHQIFLFSSDTHEHTRVTDHESFWETET